MKTYSFPPRMMKRDVACYYLQLSAAEFEREISEGRIPHPVTLGRQPHWSKAELDSYMDRLTGLNDDDWRANSPLYANGR